MKDLSQCRAEIDAIDRQIVALFEQRMQVSRDVAAYKHAHQINILDASREQAVLQSRADMTHDPVFKQPVIAGEIVYEKCQTIIDTGANVICGADVPCLLNTKGALGRMRADGRLDRDIRVMHIAQILDSKE